MSFTYVCGATYFNTVYCVSNIQNFGQKNKYQKWTEVDKSIKCVGGRVTKYRCHRKLYSIPSNASIHFTISSADGILLSTLESVSKPSFWKSSNEIGLADPTSTATLPRGA